MEPDAVIESVKESGLRGLMDEAFLAQRLWPPLILLPLAAWLPILSPVVVIIALLLGAPISMSLIESLLKSPAELTETPEESTLSMP